MKIAIIVIVVIIVVLALGHSRSNNADPSPAPAPAPPSSSDQTEHQRMLDHVNNYCDQLAMHVPGYHCVHSDVRVDGP